MEGGHQRQRGLGLFVCGPLVPPDETETTTSAKGKEKRGEDVDDDEVMMKRE